MIKTVILTALTLTVALAGGIGSAWYAIDAESGLGTTRIGSWIAAPDYGTPAADPYSQARFAREPDLILGTAEGLVFHATRDREGRPLRPACTYVVEGAFPAARFWTLHARDLDDQVLPASAAGRPPALHSRALLHAQDGTVSMTVGRRAAAGNWLSVTGSEPFMLVITLYDSAISSSARIDEVVLPEIVRTGCDD